MFLNALMGSLWTPVYAQIDLKQATMLIRDGTATPLEITVKIGEGNLSWTEARNIDYVLDRGNLDEVREGDQVPLEVSFDFVWDYIKGDQSTTTNAPSIEDALKKINNAAAWVSTDADACRPYAVDIIIIYDPDCSTGDVETITLSDFRYEQFDHDLRAGTVAVSGKCNVVAPSTIRGPQTP